MKEHIGKSNRLLLILLSLLFVPGIWWGLPSEFTPAIDSPVPHSPLAFVADYTNPDIAQKYPATHQVLLLPFYGATLLVLKLLGIWKSVSSTWPYGFQYPSAVFSALIIEARMISLVMSVGILLCVLLIGPDSLDDGGKLLSIGLLAGSGVFVYYARVGNFDIPYVFWWFLSFVFIWRYVFQASSATRNLILSAVFSAISIGTKDQAAGLVLASALTVLGVRTEAHRGWAERMRHAALFSAVLLAVYAIVAILPQPLRWLHHVKLYMPSSPSITEFTSYENTLSGHLGLLSATLSCLSNILSPPGMIFSVLGAVYFLRTRRYRETVVLILPFLTYYWMIIFNIRFVHERFMLPVALLSAIFAGTGMISFLRYLKQRSLKAHFFGKAGIAAVLCYQFVSGYLPVTYVQAFDMKRQLAGSIPEFAPKGSKVLWVGGTTGLPNANVYEKYGLVLPQGQLPPSRSVAHVFKPYASGVGYVLSGKPIDYKSEEYSLLNDWRTPDLIKDMIHVPCVTEYYLYKRNSLLKGELH